MKLLVAIVNYRVPRLTIDCLRSLARALPHIGDSRTVIVDNASGDGSEESLRQAIQDYRADTCVELVPLPRNLGYAGGNNLIVRRAMSSPDPPDYVLLLNPDTLVAEDSISRLLKFMDEHPQAGIAGARLVFPDGRPQASVFRFPSIASEFDRGLCLGVVSRLLAKWAVCPATPEYACQVDWVPGAAMMIRRNVIEAVGTLDEGYFAYFEDTDYCLSARRAGFSTWFVPESVIVHIKGASSGIAAAARLPDYWFQARRFFFLKNYGALYTALADAAFLLGCALDHLRRKIQRRRKPLPSRLLADSLSHSVFLAGFNPRI